MSEGNGTVVTTTTVTTAGPVDVYAVGPLPTPLVRVRESFVTLAGAFEISARALEDAGMWRAASWLDGHRKVIVAALDLLTTEGTAHGK